MKTPRIFAILATCAILTGLTISTSAQASVLPIVTIWETPNANGGTYTVSIDSTQSPHNWFLSAFAITTSAGTTGVQTFRSGWGADLVTSAQWDAGIDYDQEGPFGELFPVFSTSSGGIGTFADVFGPGSQAAVFWTNSHSGLPLGPNNTASDWEWLDGPPASSAIALVSGGPDGPQALACPVSLIEPGGSCVALNAEVPLPAAAWLFGSALVGLLGLARRKKRTYRPA